MPKMRIPLPAALLLCLLLLLALAPCHAQNRPKLAVVISIDQFRADYLTRFEDLFLPARTGSKVGGFRYLMEKGAWFVDAHHDHMPLYTGPGHATLLTGSAPYKNGIVSNDWYEGTPPKSVYCVEDERFPIVGSDTKLRGISPARLLVTTVGDELKMATGGQSKVFGIALKDRAAVLMAGHLADGVFWFDDKSGNWVSSKFYCKNGTLPAWLTQVNETRTPQSYFDKKWAFSAPDSARKRLWTPDNTHADNPSQMGTHFVHPLTGGLTAPGPASIKAFTTTPYAGAFTLETALKLVEAEQLGRHETPDLLAVSLSTNDYVGHPFGPDSPEVLDLTYQTDRQISTFLNGLAAQVPGGLANVTVVVTADHAVAPIAADAAAAGLNGGTWPGATAVKAAQEALAKELGEGKWTLEYAEPYVVLNHELLKQKGVPVEKAERIAADAIATVPGVYAAYTRSDVLAGRLPATDIAHHVTLGFHPQISGDIMVISRPGYMAKDSDRGATHGEPYPYDTHVPILIGGFGVRPGVRTERVSTMDIAPTLSWLLRVQIPSGSDGRILSGAIATKR